MNLPKWKFVLAHSYGDMPSIGELHEAHDKQLTKTLNRPGNLSFNIRCDSDLAYEIVEIETCVRALKNNKVVWSGPVVQTEDDAVNNKLSVTCNGWFDLLNYRMCREDKTWASERDDVIAFDLLNREANRNTLTIPHKVIDGENLSAPSVSWITSGDALPDEVNGPTFLTETLANVQYKAWSSNIGQEIVRLSDFENGFDFEVDPVTRKLNIWRKKIHASDAVFSFGWGPKNLATASRQRNATETLNWLHLIGNGGINGDAYDDTVNSSIPRLGYFENTASLANVYDEAVLGTYGQAEILLRQWVPTTHTLVPFPISPSGNVPSVFEDFDVGDTIHAVIRKGRFDTGDVPQEIRVFGVTVSIPDQGAERITSMQIYFGSASSGG